MNGLPMEPEGRAHGTSQRRGNLEMPLGADIDDVFLVFPHAWGGGTAVFRDLGAYGKESCRMSKNKVVHHKGHYRKLLQWFECPIGH